MVIPQFVGLTVTEASEVAHDGGHLVLTAADPDGPPLGALTWPGEWEITAQRPAAGTVVERGSAIVVAFVRRDGGGGEAGDREPRVPEPPAGFQAVELADPSFLQG